MYAAHADEGVARSLQEWRAVAIECAAAEARQTCWSRWSGQCTFRNFNHRNARMIRVQRQAYISENRFIKNLNYAA
jgi:hypothetical protein